MLKFIQKVTKIYIFAKKFARLAIHLLFVFFFFLYSSLIFYKKRGLNDYKSTLTSVAQKAL